MNKVLCLAMGISLFLTRLHAQSHVGLEGSALASSMPGNVVGNPTGLTGQQRTPRLSGSGGLWADIRLSDYVDFQPHLTLAAKGAGLSVNGANAGYFHATYLELPLRLMYRVPVGYDDFFIGGGIYGAVGLQGTFRTTIDSVPGVSRAYAGDIHFGDFRGHPGLYLTPWDAGYTAAAAYQCSFGLVFHLDYSRGFVNISQQPPFKIQNQGLTLGIGYLFHYNTRD